MKPWRQRVLRIGRWIVAGLVSAELFYLVVANVILLSGLLPRLASKPVENLLLNVDWDWALTPWPGRAYVSGFRIRVQDPVVQLHLTVAYAKADVALGDLFHHKFRATYAYAEGVNFRIIPRIDTTDGIEKRAAAFPVIEGFPRPALAPNPRPPYPSPAQLAKIWDVEFDAIDATLDEIWVMEYRYEGRARVHGGFAIVPLRHLWVGPAELQLNGGALSAGAHQISRALTARVALTIVPVDLLASPGVLLMKALSASAHLDTAIEDLSVVEMYVDDVQLRGTGQLALNLTVDSGKVMPGSTLELSLRDVDAQARGAGFQGEAEARLSVPSDRKTPEVHVTAGGALKVPLPGEETVSVALSRVAAELVLANNDLSQGLKLERLSGALGEARVKDARPITRLAGKYVPIIAPLVLGDGPLVASARGYMTTDYKLIRLLQAKLGDVEFEGAAVAGAGSWGGAAGGHFGKIPLGLRLREGAVESVQLIEPPWLDEELIKAGIKPEPPRVEDPRPNVLSQAPG